MDSFVVLSIGLKVICGFGASAFRINVKFCVARASAVPSSIASEAVSLEKSFSVAVKL